MKFSKKSFKVTSRRHTDFGIISFKIYYTKLYDFLDRKLWLQILNSNINSSKLLFNYNQIDN